MSIQQINRVIDDWWDQQFEQGDVDIKRVADIGADALLKDAEFCRLFTAYYIRNVVYNRGIDRAGRVRSLIREEGRAIAQARPVMPPPRSLMVAPIAQPEASTEQPKPGFTVPTLFPETKPTPAPIQTPMVSTRSWSDYLERDPETGHHISIKSFNKPNLLKKSRAYYDRGGKSIQTGAILGIIAGRLPDDTTSVGDVFTDHDLNMIVANLSVKLRAEVGLTGIGAFTWEQMLT